jgi:hypothetical protein
MSGRASPELVDTFAKLRGERKGVEWVGAVVNLRMSSSGNTIGEPRKAADRGLWVISGGFMLTTGNDTARRASMPSYGPRATPSAASGSSG